MARRKRVLWTEIVDAKKQRWPVYLVPFIKEDRTHRGITDPEAREIRIAYSNDYDLMCQTLLHEMMHACSPRVMKVGEKDPRKLADFHGEEAFIREIEDDFHASLVSIGFVFPEIPDEASLLAA